MTRILATWEQPGLVALNAAIAARQAGSDLITAIEAGLSAAELDPELIAIGLGSVPNAEGELELDASIMDGRTLEAGAVCAVRDIVPVISVARKVMECTPHVMLAGDQARRFAIQQGFEPRDLLTAESRRRYAAWKATPGRDAEYVHTVKDGPSDTVTMLGIEQLGSVTHFIAASSTSGMSFKLPGRVGDSPIVGAGIYADDEVGAAGATGLGEELWKACASFRVIEKMRNGGSVKDACEDTVRFMLRRLPAASSMPCVVFGLDTNGNFHAATTKGEFPLWSWDGAEATLHKYSALA